MDILTHTLSGLAAGTVAAGFSKRGFTAKAVIVAVSGLGGALPDLDAVSLWSGFDSTIGRFFGLTLPGADIYSGKLWYSHHGFLHSLAAGGMFALLVGLVACLIGKRRGNTPLPVGAMAGFTIHLLEDMPTPASTWGGVRMFWPLDQYVGGTGDIWWWNNYDIFLVALAVFVTGAILLLVQRFIRFDVRRVIIALFALGCLVSVVQIHSRDVDYAYTGHTDKYGQFETASKEQQREILGNRLYRAMEWFDNKLPVHF
jgi:membrane-bound metal-dependent hydrolase YbcI (DUF457 family)